MNLLEEGTQDGFVVPAISVFIYVVGNLKDAINQEITNTNKYLQHQPCRRDIICLSCKNIVAKIKLQVDMFKKEKETVPLPVVLHNTA